MSEAEGPAPVPAPPGDPLPGPIGEASPPAPPPDTAAPPPSSPVTRGRRRRRPPAPTGPPRFPWRAFVLALLVLAAGVAAMKARSERPAKIGWASAVGADPDAVESVYAGQILRTSARLSGRILLGAVTLVLAPAGEIRLVSETAAVLTRGDLDVGTVGGVPFSVAFAVTATAAPPLLFPPTHPGKAALAASSDEIYVSVREGLFEWGDIRLGPGDRAVAHPGGSPVKLDALPPR